MVDHDDDDGLSDKGELSVLSDDEDDESNDAPGIHNTSPPIASSDKQGRQPERENPVPITQRAPSSDSVQFPSIMNLLNHAPPPPPEVRSASRSAHNSPHAYGYAPEREVAMRYATPYTHTHGPEATMSPLALDTGLPSPPASGSTNPYNRVDPSPPTLRLPSPRGNLVEIREERP